MISLPSGGSLHAINPLFCAKKLGSDNVMRGYYEGRYRDKVYLVALVECRPLLFWRVGSVAFVGAGDVVHRLQALSLVSLKLTYGFGLRFALECVQMLNVRADFAWGKGTSGASGKHPASGRRSSSHRSILFRQK